MTRTLALVLAASLLTSAHAQDQETAPAAESEVGDDRPVGIDLRTLSAEDVEQRLNTGSVCGPLRFDLRDIGSLVGLTLPSFIPIDTELRWNQDRHDVTLFQVVDRSLALEVALACQPSSNGAILEYLGVTPERVRVRDRALCIGETDEAGRIETIDCTVDGRIGAGLARVTSMDAQIRDALAGTEGDAPASRAGDAAP